MACRYTYQGKTYEAHEFDDVLRAMPIAEAAKYMPGVSSLPAAPFIDDTPKWLNLALKRVIKLGVDEGYDAISFVTGEQSADRYDLSKQVGSVRWASKPGADVGKLTVKDLNGNVVLRERTASPIKAAELEDFIGKELARKLIESQPSSTTTYGDEIRELKGLDLKVGGEGMRAFYGNTDGFVTDSSGKVVLDERGKPQVAIVPAAASALVKKMGGEGMTAFSIANEDRARKIADAEARQLPDNHLWGVYLTSTNEWLVGDDGTTSNPSIAGAYSERAARSAADAMNRTARELQQRPLLQQPGFLITDSMREKASGPMPLFSRERGWDGFPDAVIASPLSAQTKDTDYAAAKAGDTKAASRLVGRVLPQQAIDQVRQMIGDLKPVVVPVSAEEAAGRNKIPLAAAARLSSALGLDIDVDIVQSTRARRSGADGMARLGLQPEFDGQVQSGRDYLLVDDTLTQGGTLAQLKTFIERGGGRVIGAFALGGKQYSATLAPDADTISRLRDKYGSIEDWWRSELGYGFHGLTQSEARYILASGLAPEALRDRVAAARREAGVGRDDARLSRERAAWTPERIDRLLGNYAYTMDDEKSKAYAGFVSPEDYLRATTPASGVARLESENKPLDAAELRGQVQPIMLIGEPTDARTWKTTGHEGRHRMMALRDAGVRRVPVVFQVGYGLKREPMSNVFVTAQRWSGGPEAQGGFIVESLTPISYKYAKELKETFGGDGDIRFSRERTETPEFKRWFGESKVVDAQGRPLVVYHGTNADFTAFDPSETFDGGLYFTDNAEHAEEFAAIKGSGPARTMPVYLSIKSPLIIDARVDDLGDQFNADWQQRLEDEILSVQAGRTHDGIVVRNMDALGYGNYSTIYIAFRPEQIKSAIGNDGSYDENDPNILSSAERNWASPGASKFDDVVYKMQNRQVDLLRVQQAIQETGQQISEDRNTYLREELFHGRAAKRTQDFTKRELEPLTEEMAKRGLTLEELDEYLHARHAPEANRLIAERNPDSPLLQDGGSGLDTALAQQYMADLTADKKAHLEAVAAMVDKILAKTRQLMVDYELESKDTVKGWGEMFQHYVPLMREDDGDAPQRLGTGQGYSIKGREVKSRTGSTKKVVDILANIAMQRERVIVRGEKNRVGQALVNLARENENKDFWTVDLAPTTPTYDPKKGVVVQRPDPMYKMRPNVVVAKFREEDGSVKEHAVIFNEGNARAMRTAAAMKSMDVEPVEGLMGVAAGITRYFASIVTQYNPVFGIINYMRDFQAALFNLKSTELDGMQKQVAVDSMKAMKAIYQGVRSDKRDTEWQKLWDDFTTHGGQTGFRQMFATSQDRADAIREVINPDYWMDSKFGKVFTANGVLKMPISRASKIVKSGFQWLSDYNETLENATRLAVYKAGLDKGLSKEQAASIAKNATANFNRRGQVAQQVGALYAFFGASMAGTARLGQLLFTMDKGDIKTLRLSRVGQRIVMGGVLLGVAQALALAAMGFSDEDPPAFVRERSLVIPTGGKNYIAIPMPLGLHILPNIGRSVTEWSMGGFKDTPERAVDFVGLLFEAFNPIGSAGLSMQTLAPTMLDPLVALTENQDWQGRPITRESMNPATPGHLLAKDTATSWARALSEFVNYISGGNQYVAGAISPSPDQIDYVVAALGGGVAREISKLEQTVRGAITGEEVPTYKIPLVGRLVGSASGQSSEGTAFYANTRALNELETEIKGLQKDGKFAEAAALRASRPDAYLIAQANRAERDIQKLRKQKTELVRAGAPRDQVKAIEDKITARMAALNRATESLRAKAEAS